ncbi:unnamed protein product [Peronospora belbahrii]|uniref:Ribosomal protein S18 n=1 Tax=Peronospora belbahrii TaxID=622444 RepID=A0AAU9KJN3_9STRA|nr:unnamed protein product [Peronospora belbahrii]CAH0520545.1 unnamed protein product [Peronospora belbahrii]
MMRVWLRPCASAIAVSSPLRRCIASNIKNGVLQAQIFPHTLTVYNDSLLVIGGIRSMVTKGKDDNKKELKKKKSMFEKVEEIEDLTELPDEVKYLSQELSEDKFEVMEELGEEEEDDEDDEDADLSPANWAKKFEQDVAEWDQEENAYYDDDDVANASIVSDIEDDRLYVEMPGFDASLSLAESQIGVNENKGVPDPFQHWDQGMAISPEMLNWMLPADKRKPFKKDKTKPWKYFVAANHPDVVELALDVDLLRLFISPTGRIRPRRFTGLTAKQQRKLARAIKISRQLALLPYLSRYPEPTPEQWKAIDDEIIAAAELEDDNDDVDDDDDEDFDEDFEYD